MESQLTLWDIRVRKEEHVFYFHPETPGGQEGLKLIGRLTAKGYRVKVVEQRKDKQIELWTAVGPVRGLENIRHFVERELNFLEEVPSPAPGITPA